MSDTVEAVIKGGRIITKVGDKRIEAGSLLGIGGEDGRSK